MSKTEYDLRAIMYPAYGTQHILYSIIENKTQLIRYLIEQHKQNMASAQLYFYITFNYVHISAYDIICQALFVVEWLYACTHYWLWGCCNATCGNAGAMSIA